MTDKELIKQEIERRIENLSYLIPDVSNIGNLTMEDVGYYAKSEALKSILQFINSLPEETTDETMKENYNERYKRITQTEQFKESYCDKSLEKEESANDDLEEEIKSWIPTHIEGGDEYLREVAIEWSEIVARHFAEWQKQQMKEALQTEYEKGRFDMKEEMMKNAVEGTVVSRDHSTMPPFQTKCKIVVDRVSIDAKEGDKVKVVIIKTGQ